MVISAFSWTSHSPCLKCEKLDYFYLIADTFTFPAYQIKTLAIHYSQKKKKLFPSRNLIYGYNPKIYIDMHAWYKYERDLKKGERILITWKNENKIVYVIYHTKCIFCSWHDGTVKVILF